MKYYCYFIPVFKMYLMQQSLLSLLAFLPTCLLASQPACWYLQKFWGEIENFHTRRQLFVNDSQRTNQPGEGNVPKIFFFVTEFSIQFLFSVQFYHPLWMWQKANILFFTSCFFLLWRSMWKWNMKNVGFSFVRVSAFTCIRPTLIDVWWLWCWRMSDMITNALYL